MRLLASGSRGRICARFGAGSGASGEAPVPRAGPAHHRGAGGGHWGRKRCIGVGKLPAPMGGSLPQCACSCPNGRFRAHVPASRTDDGGSLPQCDCPARRAPGPAPGASGELLLPLALERASCPSLGAQNGSAAWRAGCESADKDVKVKITGLPEIAKGLVAGRG